MGRWAVTVSVGVDDSLSRELVTPTLTYQPCRIAGTLPVQSGPLLKREMTSESLATALWPEEWS